MIPGLSGPIQSLTQMLPQILPFFAAGLAGLLSSRAWRDRFARWGRAMTTTRGLAVTLGVVAVLTALPFVLRGKNRSQAASAGGSGASGKGADWTMFRANLLRTGAAGSTGPVLNAVAWSFSDPEARSADLSSSPAVVGDRVYVSSAQASVFDSSGMVYCIDAKTGSRIWRFQTEKQGFSSPAVVGGRVYVGEGLHSDTNCKLYCLNAATGKLIWAAPTRSHTEASPAVVNGRVYTGAGGDGLYCFDAGTGKPVWHYAGAHVDVSPAVAGGRVYAGTGYGKLTLLALDATTGKPVWTVPSDLPVWGDPSIVGDRVYYGTGNGDFVKSASNPHGAVWCLEAATGKKIWRRDLPDAVLTAIVVQGNRAYAGCRDGKAYAFDTANGKPVWSVPCGGPVVSSPATDGANLYVAGGNGRLLSLELATGKTAWSLDLAAKTSPDVKLFSSPALAGGRLYVGTSKEKLFCLGR